MTVDLRKEVLGLALREDPDRHHLINSMVVGVAREPGGFVVIDGVECFGPHLLLGIVGADPQHLNDPARLEAMFREAIQATGATLVKDESGRDRLWMHQFHPQGVTGAAILAESHITIHTWPQHGKAAMDMFTCGACDPRDAIPIFERFLPGAKITPFVMPRPFE